MAELNKSNFTEELHIDLHGSSINLNRLAIGHTIFIMYLVNKCICFVVIHAKIIQMYLFSIKCEFYCIYTLDAFFIHVFT